MEVYSMKTMVLLVGTLLMLGFFSLVFAENVGVVDVNKILANAQQIKDIQADLKKQFDPRGQKIINSQKAFRDDIEKYRQNNTTLQGEALRQEQQKLIDENKKSQDDQLNFRRDLIAAQNQALRPVLAQIESIVNKIAQERKFDLVITKVSTAYNNPQLEITDQVIAEMEKLGHHPGFLSKVKNFLFKIKKLIIKS
jgi:outer membrane protein